MFKIENGTHLADSGLMAWVREFDNNLRKRGTPPCDEPPQGNLPLSFETVS